MQKSVCKAFSNAKFEVIILKKHNFASKKRECAPNNTLSFFCNYFTQVSDLDFH